MIAESVEFRTAAAKIALQVLEAHHASLALVDLFEVLRDEAEARRAEP